jgi:hypothetical protein
MKAPAQSHPASKCQLTSLKNNPESVPGQLRWLRTAAECHKTTHLRGVGGFEPASGLRTRKQRRTAQFLDLYAKLVTARASSWVSALPFLRTLRQRRANCWPRNPRSEDRLVADEIGPLVGP